MWAAIRASISLVISAGLAYIRIRSIMRSDKPNELKIQGVENELSKISAKLDALASATDPTWDDELAEVFSAWLTEIAELIIGEPSNNVSSTGG